MDVRKGDGREEEEEEEVDVRRRCLQTGGQWSGWPKGRGPQIRRVCGHGACVPWACVPWAYACIPDTIGTPQNSTEHTNLKVEFLHFLRVMSPQILRMHQSK